MDVCARLDGAMAWNMLSGTRPRPIFGSQSLVADGAREAVGAGHVAYGEGMHGLSV